MRAGNAYEPRTAVADRRYKGRRDMGDESGGLRAISSLPLGPQKILHIRHIRHIRLKFSPDLPIWNNEGDWENMGASISSAVTGLLAGQSDQALATSQTYAVSKANDLNTTAGQEIAQAIDQTASAPTNGHIDVFA